LAVDEFFIEVEPHDDEARNALDALLRQLRSSNMTWHSIPAICQSSTTIGQCMAGSRFRPAMTDATAG